MKVSDIMTRRVISIGPAGTILEAVRLMLQNHISRLPVIDADGALVGIVTEGDFLRRAETGTQRKRPRWLEFFTGPGKLADEYVHTHGRKIEEVMTPEPATVTEEAPLDEVVRLMEARRIKRLPVVRGGRVVGIVSRANLLHALASFGRKMPPSTPNDTAIREQILQEIDKQSWTSSHLINVLVRNGVVELWGTIFDGTTGAALKVLAENVPGVERVEDHLAWFEPVSGMVIVAAGEAVLPMNAAPH
jgi:CBS domain-containing protein